MEWKELTKSKCLKKTTKKNPAVSKKCVKCNNYGSKILFNAFTSNIRVQSKCIISISMDRIPNYQYECTWSTKALAACTPAVAAPQYWCKLLSWTTREYSFVLHIISYHNPVNLVIILLLPSVALSCSKFTHGIQVTPWFLSVMPWMLTGPDIIDWILVW